ncbi:MAG: copper resistance protein B [Sphingobium sp.]|nr:copper resistance protein B [Sphingobium sp.]
MRLAVLPLLALMLTSLPLRAQQMDHSGHDMGARTHEAPSPSPPPADPHAGHAMPAEVPMDHGGTTAASELPPLPPKDWAADSVYDPASMARARAGVWREHGGGRFSQILFNLAEYQVREGRDGFRWDGEGWFGGDIHRLTLKTEGTATHGAGVEDAEIQALYSRAVGPYFNLQAGVRHDIRPRPARNFATLGIEGLAPYWFDVEAAIFLSNKGNLLARLEATYDQRVIQRLILQPRLELNVAAQDVPESGIGSGLSDAELGLRLRYEIAREFAPYIGLSHDRRLGDTARLERAAGEDPSRTSVVLGIRFWF